MSSNEPEKVLNPDFQKKGTSEISSIEKSSHKFGKRPSVLLESEFASPTNLNKNKFPEVQTLDLNTLETALRKNTDFSVPLNNQTLSLNNDDPKEEIDDFNQIFKNQFIGEFHTDRNFKIIRAYINQNTLDRIFYTRFEPTARAARANILIVHGYGHSGNFLEVYSLDGSLLCNRFILRPSVRFKRLRLLWRQAIQPRSQCHY